MPYVKLGSPKFEKMRRLLLGYGLNGPALARVIECSDPTARKRLDDPGLLTLADIEKINRKGHISMEDIRNAICFEQKK